MTSPSQVVVYLMKLACHVAKQANWIILQSSSQPLLNSTLAKGGRDYREACSILLQTSDAHR